MQSDEKGAERESESERPLVEPEFYVHANNPLHYLASNMSSFERILPELKEWRVEVLEPVMRTQSWWHHYKRGHSASMVTPERVVDFLRTLPAACFRVGKFSREEKKEDEPTVFKTNIKLSQDTRAGSEIDTQKVFDPKQWKSIGVDVLIAASKVMRMFQSAVNQAESGEGGSGEGEFDATAQLAAMMQRMPPPSSSKKKSSSKAAKKKSPLDPYGEKTGTWVFYGPDGEKSFEKSGITVRWFVAALAGAAFSHRDGPLHTGELYVIDPVNSPFYLARHRTLSTSRSPLEWNVRIHGSGLEKFSVRLPSVEAVGEAWKSLETAQQIASLTDDVLL